MTELIGVSAFLSVILRGLTLAFEALTVGGVIFAFLVRGLNCKRLIQTRLLRCFAALLAISELLAVSLNCLILVVSTDLAWSDAITADFSIAGAIVVAGAIAIVATAPDIAASGGARDAVASMLILGGSVLNSHSVSRLDHQWLLVALTLAHHLASAAWIGGLPYLIASLRTTPDTELAAAITSRFSRLACGAVGVVIAAGVGLSYFYVGSTAALAGTTYGIMLLAKILLVVMLIGLGTLNLRTTRALHKGRKPPLLGLRRIAEAEAGIGCTVLLAAASLTSTPPAVDVPGDIVTPGEIGQRMSPTWPLMKTPPLSSLSPATPLDGFTAVAEARSYIPGQVFQRVDTPGDIAWSEYNHHWAGLAVLAIGLAAVLAQRFRWARNWPLLFLGLAVFLFLRADSENWPLGPRGFWESFQVAEVAQHRMFVLLIVAFSVFELAVQKGRLASGRAGLVFPCICVIGGTLLLTHSHSLVNVKNEFLAELSHLPIALLAVAAGWSRWLEIRFPERRQLTSWIWPFCFVLIGAILLNYRES